jgi:AP-1 complex subunit mu
VDDTLFHDSDSLVLALSRRNTNAAEIILFLHRLSQVLVEYFKELEEESIRDNFVIIYELLDEMMDFGYPQTTESKILQELVFHAIRRLCTRKPSARYITQESHKLEIQVRPPMAVTNAVSWRSEGIRYRKNEVFLDVIESVNLLVRLIRDRQRYIMHSIHAGQCQWQRRSIGNTRCHKDEVLPFRHARTETRPE